MSHLLDTDVAIHFRNRQPEVLRRIVQLAGPPFLSVISQVEMEGGVYANPTFQAERRLTLDTLLETVTVLAFDSPVVAIYRDIVARIGFSRRKVADRMIAATALAHDLTLVTMNGRDFADVPDLRLDVWSSPAD